MSYIKIEDDRKALALLDIKGHQTHLLVPEDHRTARNIGFVVLALLGVVLGLVAVASILG